MSVSSARSSPRGAPFLFARQRRLLALLDALGGRVGDLDFQQLLFLYCQEPDAAGAYEFVPCKLGAFSFTAHADRCKLVERGLLADDAQSWQLTDAGRKSAGPTQDLYLLAFARRHDALRGQALVAEAYRRFPYHATRSEIAENVLAGDAAALERIRAARPSAKAGAIATIGYEGRSLESYLNELLGSGVTILCDVRRNAISRKFGFSKDTLARGCTEVGIRYEHLPELGIASEQRQGLETQADVDDLFEVYERDCLPRQGPAIAKIRAWFRSGERVALTCYERLPYQCHRHCLAEALERKIGKGFAVNHL